AGGAAHRVRDRADRRPRVDEPRAGRTSRDGGRRAHRRQRVEEDELRRRGGESGVEVRQGATAGRRDHRREGIPQAPGHVGGKEARVRVDVDGMAMYVHEHGEGEPILMVPPGPGTDGSVFFPWFEGLEGYRLLGVDLPGHGRSDRGDPDRWTVADWATD